MSRYKTGSDDFLSSNFSHHLLLAMIHLQQCISVLGMLNSFFSKFKFRLLKFGLNLNFVYICLWRSLSNLRLMSALCGEMKVTARTPHARKQSVNSTISQDAKPC